MADGYGVFNPTVDLNPYATQIADIQRRQRMAQLLQQQGLEPLESQVVGGQVIRTSPWQVLAKALQTGLGAYQGRQADKAAADLQDKIAFEQRQKEADIASAASGIAGRMFGEKPTQYDKNGLPIGREPYMPPDLTPDEMGNTPRAPKPITLQPGQAESGSRNRSFAQSISEGDQLGEITPTAKYQYDPAAAMQMAMTPAGTEAMKGNPLMASLLAQMVKPKEAEKFGTTPVRGADGKYYLISESGRMVPTNVAGFDKEAAPTDLSKLIAERNALPANSPLRKTYDAAIAKQSERSPGVNVTVPVTTSRSYGQEVASSLAKADSDAIAAARAAPEQIASSQRIRNLLAQNPITGTGAEARLALDKALSTAGLIDPDRSITTENLITELANGTLAAVKSSGLGTGTGFTEKDLEFLQKAKSGNIEINAATLARIADLNERAARAAGAKGNAVINRLSKSGNFGPELGLEPVELPPISGALPPGFTPDRRR